MFTWMLPSAACPKSHVVASGWASATTPGTRSMNGASAGAGRVTSSLCGAPRRVDGFGVALPVAPQLGPPGRVGGDRHVRHGAHRVERRGHGRHGIDRARPPRPVGTPGGSRGTGAVLRSPGRPVRGRRARNSSSDCRSERDRRRRNAASTASGVDENARRATTRSGLGGTRRSRAAVTTPSVPSLPQSNPARS